MQKVFIFLLLISFSCSPNLTVIYVKINSFNEVVIQNEKISIHNFEKKLDSLTQKLSAKQITKLTFDIKADKESNVGVISEIGTKIRTFKKSKKIY